MANNYEQAVMSQNLPASWFTTEDLGLMQEQGWSFELCETNPEGSLYFYIGEGECYDPDEHPKSWKTLLQEKLSQHDKTLVITIMGAYTCSKMRRGEFGGYLHAISWNREKFVSTHELEADFIAELGKDVANPFIVEHEFTSGWERFLTDEVFPTREAAQKAIDELIEETRRAALDGHMSEAYDPEDFRVTNIADKE